jgi:hypothetical protein
LLVTKKRTDEFEVFFLLQQPPQRPGEGMTVRGKYTASPSAFPRRKGFGISEQQHI